MNTLNLISSTLALGAMTGISGTHYHQVKTMVEQAALPNHSPAIIQVASASQKANQKPQSQSGTLALMTPVKSQVNTPTASSIAPTSLEQRDASLMEVLLAIRAEQKNIRHQVADTNRNMDELTFRVDTHSSQFRPLRAESQTPRAMLVPDEMMRPLSLGNELLPPKQ